MAPASAPDHENIVMLLGVRLMLAVEDAGLGRVFAGPDLDLGTSVVRPDAVLVLKAALGVIAENRIVGPPDIVVEISSTVIAAYDRDADSGKREAYARAGIAEYWIVDPASRSVEVRVLEGDTYTIRGISKGESAIPSGALPDTVIRANTCFPR
jgi:Uma2 family endonuclease